MKNKCKFALNELATAKENITVGPGEEVAIRKGSTYIIYHVDEEKDLIGISLYRAHVWFDASKFSKTIECDKCHGSDYIPDPKDNHIKCIAKGCENHTDEGGFKGDLCFPCHDFITSGEVRSPTYAFWHQCKIRSAFTIHDEEVVIEKHASFSMGKGTESCGLDSGEGSCLKEHFALISAKLLGTDLKLSVCFDHFKAIKSLEDNVTLDKNGGITFSHGQS